MEDRGCSGADTQLDTAVGLAARDALEPFRTDDPLINVLGPIRWRAGDDAVQMQIMPSEKSLNAIDTLHGGAHSAWLDMAMYELAKRRLGSCVAIALDVQYVAAGKRDLITARARFNRAGRSIAFCAGDIVQNGRTLATGSAIYKKTEPASGA